MASSVPGVGGDRSRPLIGALRLRLRGDAGRGLVLSFAATLAIQALGIITGIVLARQLGPSLRGELAAVLLWPGLLVVVGSLGVHEALTFYAAREQRDTRRLLTTGAVLAVVQGLGMVLIGAAIVPLVLSRYPSSAAVSSLIYVAAMPAAYLALFLMYALNGMHRFGWFSFLRVLVIAIGAVAMVVWAAAGGLTVRTAVISTVSGILMTALCATVVALRVTTGRTTFDRSLARSLLGFGVRSQLSSVSNLLNDRLDQLVISVFLASADLGLYVVAWTLTSLSGLIGASVAVVALPAIARTHSGAARTAAVRRYLWVTAAAVGVVTFGLLLFCSTLVEAAFGDRFAGAVDPARILLLASIPLALTRVLGALLKGINRPVEAGVAEGIALVVTVVGLLTLLPIMGTLGAAVVSLLAYLTSMIFSAGKLADALGVPRRALIVGGMDEPSSASAPR